MAFSRTRAQTRFTAGEQAPAPMEAIGGDIQITNHVGNLVLNVPQVDPAARSGSILLDTSVEPPVIRFIRASVEVLYGMPDDDGNFVQFDHELNSGRTQVNGVYAGPGSELSVS